MEKDDIFSTNNNQLFEIAFCRAKGNVSTELDGETVILDITSGVYSGLDVVGTTIWKLLENPTTVVQLREQLLQEYDVSLEQCTTDLLAFLQRLADNDLIIIENEAIG
jgi:hypothetical protein